MTYGSKKSQDLNLVNGGTVSTPLKFNMEPENQPLEKEIPALETIIFRFHVKFCRCIPYIVRAPWDCLILSL